MTFRFWQYTSAVVLLFPSIVLGQTTPDAPAKTGAVSAKPAQDKIQQVEVKGKAEDYDPRRDDTASKTVLNRAEIEKYADTNIYDVLKRAPGVTVTGGNVLRMHGLGAGYTQILVNGDRPPPGFSMDALTPDQIERIEIIRSASAEYSMQAIAGTINIILRNVVDKPQRDARAGLWYSSRNKGGSLSGTWGERTGNLSWSLQGFVFGGTSNYQSDGVEQFFAPDRVLTQSRERHKVGKGDNRSIALLPRLVYKSDGGDELSLQAILRASRTGSESYWTTHTQLGTFPAPDFTESIGGSPGTQRAAQANLNWVSKIAGGKLDLTLTADQSRYTSNYDNVLYTDGRALRMLRNWDTTTTGHRYSARGKYTRSMFDGHSMAMGFDASRQQTDEARDRREQQDDQPLVHTVEYFSPEVTRAAAFGQDEWNVTPNLSAYLGARWEGVDTDSSGALTSIHAREHVLGPVAQGLYKFPDKSGRQLRLALTRTYKSPTIDQLSARRYESALNTRFTPDSGGNPDLKPELATGIDATFERFWSEGAMYSISMTRRAITDYIRTRLDQDAQGRWIYHPTNDGDALVRSLEAEIKMPLKMLLPFAGGIDVHASAARNWSTVSTVPGPNNRLDAQVPFSAHAGFDFKQGNLSFGSNFGFQQGGWVQVSDAQSEWQQAHRDLDAYVLWKLDAHYQVRASVANLLGTGSISEQLYQDASGLSRQAYAQPGVVRSSLTLEAKF